jgi:hypothetical protein
MFITQTNKETYVFINRTPPNNTRLFDRTLRYHPHKDKDLRDEELRLEVDLRSIVENGTTYCVITAGMRELKNNIMDKSRYTKIFDFPFSKPYTKSVITDEELEKYGFKVKRSSPWYDKDEFGKVTAHQWETEIEYRHKSGAVVTWQT